MTIVKSQWINFLRQYGPIPRNDNMYDEAIHRILQQKKIKPIQISSEYMEELIENFQSESPASVILTGTAGDGKTYYCREIWSYFGGSLDTWESRDKVKQLKLPNSNKTLFVVKDLSELQDFEKKDILEQLSSILQNPDEDKMFLIAANDGQLIEAWKHANPKDNPQIERVKKHIEDLLVNGEKERPGIKLKLYNLSQVNAAKLFPQIVHAILNHPGWNECQNCSLREGDGNNKCPIWENRKRMEGSNDGQLILTRLTDLLELCELNDIHLPIRQLFLLVSNMLLGHPDAKDHLMNCSEAARIVSENKTALASIYRNIFGENLPEKRRENTRVFEALGKFGVGYETNNFIDNVLIFGADDPEFERYYQDWVVNDSYYGANQIYRANQKDYLEGRAEIADDFLLSLRSQRQRLFFIIPKEQEEESHFWRLTAFHYAGEYLNEVYRRAQHGKVSSQITARIVQGLNRIFTGFFVRESDKLILATSGSHSQAKVSRIFEEEISVPKRHGQGVQIVMKNGKPCLEVKLSHLLPAEYLPLNLVRFEFLSRVAEGALPGSFSRECYEDILDFKSKLLNLVERLRLEEGDDSDPNQLTFQIIRRLTQEGTIDHNTVEVNCHA